MKYALILIVLFSFGFAHADKSKQQRALVYNGAGGCKSCALAAAKVARQAGFSVQYVSPSEIEPALLSTATLWIQPAGNAISAATGIGIERLAYIRDFVKNGGAYVGFCAGAFLADATVDDDGKVTGIGILPVVTADYEVNEKSNIGIVWTKWNGVRRNIFFNGGATFILDPKKKNRLKILATYEKDNQPATIETTFGLGKVVVSGAHPEAPNKWKARAEEDDEDGSDIDLAVDMVSRATGLIK